MTNRPEHKKIERKIAEVESRASLKVAVNGREGGAWHFERAKKRRKREKWNREARSEPEVSHVTLVCQTNNSAKPSEGPKREKRREIRKSDPDLCVTDGEQPLKKKRKNRKRKRKLISMDENDRTANAVPTLANYPKLSSGNEVSCNWKKLCKDMNISKSTSGHRNEHVKKLKTTVPFESSSKSQISMENDIWFDGVDRELIEASQISQSRITKKGNNLVKEGSFTGLTSAVAMDCEMVGIGENATDSMLARVSIVNLMGNCIYDKYVKPMEPVVDYRTAVSGIRPSDIEKGEDFKVVQKEVSDILDKRILVGHAVHNDLKVLFLTHPKRKIRDTSSYKPFRHLFCGNTPSLKRLTEKLLAVKVQEGEHNSVQDAQAAMRLYTMHKIDWENSIKKKQAKKNKASGMSKSSSTVRKLSNSPTTRKFSQLKI